MPFYKSNLALINFSQQRLGILLDDTDFFRR